jgi:methyl-accepting chemotaxis protein
MVAMAAPVVTVCAAWAAGSGLLVPVLIVSLAMSGLAYSGLLAQNRTGRIIVSAALIGQVMALTAALRGHPMQADMHMVFFAALPLVATLTSRFALLIAVGIIALHHLSATVLAPELVYLTRDLGFNLIRTAVHAIVVALAAASLLHVVYVRLYQTSSAQRRARKLQAAMEEARTALETAEARTRDAEEARRHADGALADAAAARAASDAAREEAERNAASARRAEAETAAMRESHEREVEQVLVLISGKLSLLASGDLRVRISEDLPESYRRLGNVFNEAVDSLETVMRDVLTEAASIRTHSDEIASTSDNLSRRIETQSSALTQIASSLQQLTALISGVAEDTNGARSQAEGTREQAESGMQIMSRTVTAMDAIETSSSEIRKIISVIENIAFQTNLLALNAGVEAARAGEAGRGFAVVATEVRALAQRSSDAASEIDGLINTSVSQISDGVRLVKETGTALDRIQKSVNEIAERMETVASATTEQSTGLQGVHGSVSNLDSVTQEFASRFEETTAANTVLSQNARRLGELVGQFKVEGMARALPSRGPGGGGASDHPGKASAQVGRARMKEVS